MKSKEVECNSDGRTNIAFIVLSTYSSSDTRRYWGDLMKKSLSAGISSSVRFSDVVVYLKAWSSTHPRVVQAGEWLKPSPHRLMVLTAVNKAWHVKPKEHCRNAPQHSHFHTVALNKNTQRRSTSKLASTSPSRHNIHLIILFIHSNKTLHKDTVVLENILTLMKVQVWIAVRRKKERQYNVVILRNQSSWCWSAWCSGLVSNCTVTPSKL